MQELIGQLVNGLAAGSVYAVIALGFALIFGVANVVNFAQGSQVVAGAYLAWAASTYWGLSLPLALLVAMVGSVIIAIVVDLIAVEWLGDSADIAPLLSTLALSFIIDQSIRLIFSPNPVAFPNPVAGMDLQIGSTHLGATDVLILAITVTVMLVTWLFLRMTWMGRAIRATAQDASAAQQMGVHTGAAKLIVFAISGLLGAVGGVLLGMYFQQIDPSMGLPYGLKGFAAAMIGGVASLPGSVLGGLLIGILEALVSGYIGSAWQDLLAFGLLLVILIARPQGLLGSRTLQGLGGVRGAGAIPTTSPLADNSGFPVMVMGAQRIRTRWTLALVAALGLVSCFVFNGYWSGVFAQGAIFATAALGLTVLTGMCGYVSVGHGALMGVGAYLTALVVTGLGWPFEAVFLATMLAGLAFGLLFAIPVLKLSGHMVALATLALGQIGYLIMLNAVPVTRGPMGIGGINEPVFALWGGAAVDTVAGVTAIAFGVLFVAVMLVHVLLRSHVSRNFRAIREDRLAADAFGIHSTPYVVVAFMFSGLVAALSGMVFAYQQSFVSPDSFLILFSFLILTMVLAGGIVSPMGAVIGGVVLIALPELLRGHSQYRDLIYGAILILIIKFLPSGLSSIGRAFRAEAAPVREDDPPSAAGAS